MCWVADRGGQWRTESCRGMPSPLSSTTCPGRVTARAPRGTRRPSRCSTCRPRPAPRPSPLLPGRGAWSLAVSPHEALTRMSTSSSSSSSSSSSLEAGGQRACLEKPTRASASVIV